MDHYCWLRWAENLLEDGFLYIYISSRAFFSSISDLWNPILFPKAAFHSSLFPFPVGNLFMLITTRKRHFNKYWDGSHPPFSNHAVGPASKAWHAFLPVDRFGLWSTRLYGPRVSQQLKERKSHCRIDTLPKTGSCLSWCFLFLTQPVPSGMENLGLVRLALNN